jgi:uncharacterized protein YjiS (DUF1127 family)
MIEGDTTMSATTTAMTTVTTAPVTARAAGTLLARFSTLAATLRRELRAAGVRRRTARELCALSDRDLADIGIFRCDIGRIAREAADRV